MRLPCVYVVERAADGFYWAYLPDLPGCATSAGTVADVEAKLPEAVDLYLSYDRDSYYRDRRLPPPRALVGAIAVAAT